MFEERNIVPGRGHERWNRWCVIIELARRDDSQVGSLKMRTKNGKRPPGAETVEIDREALLRLEAARSAGESISEVIKRCVRPRQTADEILRAMRRAPISESTLQAIDESASRRRRVAHRSKG